MIRGAVAVWNGSPLIGEGLVTTSSGVLTNAIPPTRLSGRDRFWRRLNQLSCGGRGDCFRENDAVKKFERVRKGARGADKDPVVCSVGGKHFRISCRFQVNQ